MGLFNFGDTFNSITVKLVKTALHLDGVGLVDKCIVKVAEDNSRMTVTLEFTPENVNNILLDRFKRA